MHQAEITAHLANVMVEYSAGQNLKSRRVPQSELTDIQGTREAGPLLHLNETTILLVVLAILSILTTLTILASPTLRFKEAAIDTCCTFYTVLARYSFHFNKGRMTTRRRPFVAHPIL